VLIATKVGSDMGGGRSGLSGDYIVRAVEDSLRRLQTEYIDLYQEHFDDGNTQVAETMQAFGRLVAQGKVRVIGASNISPSRLIQSQGAAAAQNGPRYETLQPHYNLVERRGYERDYEKLAVEQGLGVIPYYSLASGFLSGKYRSADDLGQSPRGGGVQKYLTESGLKVLAALDTVAGGIGATPAQVALAWLIARPSVTAPIVSATSVAQWQDIAQAARLTLNAEAIALLDAASG